MKTGIALFALLPLTCAAADEPARPPGSGAPSGGNSWVVESKNVSVEYRVHSFLLDSADEATLQSIVGEEGLILLRPEIAALRREWFDADRLVPTARKLCAALRSAGTGDEFADVLAASDEEERTAREERARRILSKLDVEDRAAIERHVDVTLRPPRYAYAVIDYRARFASPPFPSPATEDLTRRTCEAAAQAEAKTAGESKRSPGPSSIPRR